MRLFIAFADIDYTLQRHFLSRILIHLFPLESKQIVLSQNAPSPWISKTLLAPSLQDPRLLLQTPLEHYILHLSFEYLRWNRHLILNSIVLLLSYKNNN